MTSPEPSSAPDPLTFHPSKLNLAKTNARQGDVDLIAESLRVNGQMRPIVVNVGTYTGRPFEVIDGNHTLRAIRDLAEARPDDDRWERVLVHLVDVDDDRATRYALAANRTAQAGSMDDRLLLEMLSGLDDHIAGTGYSEEEMADLEALMQETPPDVPAGPDGLGSGGDPRDDAGSGSGDDGEEHDEGMQRNRSLEDVRDSYENLGTRIVMLAYPIAQFVWVQQALEGVAKDRGLTSNAAAVLALAAEAIGEEPPAPDAEPATAADSSAEETDLTAPPAED